MTANQQRGREAENLARRFLEEQGLRLLAQNWLCRRGELDLVMLDGDTVVFVEVRYRRHAAWGGALESVDARKQARIALAAEYFLQQEKRWGKHPCRFDVIALGATSGPTDRPEWIKNAFDA
ncbi:YraN family protein [Zestomonas carbonaria]|uniref:UPF0102 protein PSEWESI4_01094 n=1 Tax=Zestomonas carbonaria TaxID=2762745 RepID=A0A7U7I9E4_9GAMM|nr:YraN family protein [Pseudomonas carbonaria]CAD5106827.1 hypothetical protein PSEWESI4_01094 [Pseudomonas carbonaria]